MKCSENGEYTFPALGEQDASKKPNFHGIIKKAEVLGFDGECCCTRDEAGFHEGGRRKSDKPVVFRIALD